MRPRALLVLLLLLVLVLVLVLIPAWVKPTYTPQARSHTLVAAPRQSAAKILYYQAYKIMDENHLPAIKRGTSHETHKVSIEILARLAQLLSFWLHLQSVVSLELESAALFRSDVGVFDLDRAGCTDGWLGVFCILPRNSSPRLHLFPPRPPTLARRARR